MALTAVADVEAKGNHLEVPGPSHSRQDKDAVSEAASVFRWLHHMSRRILLPHLGIEPVPPAVEVWSPKHWTAGEIPARQHLEALWIQILPVIPEKLFNLSEAQGLHL